MEACRHGVGEFLGSAITFLITIIIAYWFVISGRQSRVHRFRFLLFYIFHLFTLRLLARFRLGLEGGVYIEGMRFEP